MQEHDQEQLFHATQHLMEIFITPEVMRRQEAGELTRPLELRAAQVIFYPDGRKSEVRINSEVKAIGKVKLKPGVGKNYGDPIYENELEGVKGLTLSPEDDPDCGHAMLMLLNDKWVFAFDFVYNKGLASKHIHTASQFIETAEYSLNRKFWSAFIDNLYSAAELLAKATLLTLFSDPDFREKASHKAIHSRYNRFVSFGNASPQYAEAFNKLSKLRYPARYLKGDFSILEAEAQHYLEIMKAMLEDVSRIIKLK